MPARWDRCSSCPRRISSTPSMVTTTDSAISSPTGMTSSSVAQYLHQCGWQAGGPVIADVRIEPGATFQIDPSNLRLDETIDALNAEGVRVDSDVPGNTPVVLLLAQQQDGPTYRVGFNNFHALTRYNHSALYAMAVDELAQAIAQRLNPASPGVTPAVTPSAR